MVLPAVTSFEWSANGEALFYTTADATERPNTVSAATLCCVPAVCLRQLNHTAAAAILMPGGNLAEPMSCCICLWLLQVYCRRQGRPTDDVLLFSEADVQRFITLTRTKDWRYVLINTTSKLSSEVNHWLAAVPQKMCVRRVLGVMT
jgi:protease II